MESDKIKLKTETGQTIEVVVLSKHADRIDVVLGESVLLAHADPHRSPTWEPSRPRVTTNAPAPKW
jgi:hypothetical protein